MKGPLRHVVWLGKYCVLGLEACLSITSQKVVHMAGDRLFKIYLGGNGMAQCQVWVDWTDESTRNLFERCLMFRTSLKVSPIGLIKMICESLEIEIQTLDSSCFGKWIPSARTADAEALMWRSGMVFSCSFATYSWLKDHSINPRASWATPGICQKIS